MNDINLIYSNIWQMQGTSLLHDLLPTGLFFTCTGLKNVMGHLTAGTLLFASFYPFLPPKIVRKS